MTTGTFFIKPQLRQITVNGRVAYNENQRRINLKREILEAFIGAKERLVDLDYTMELYLDKNEFSQKVSNCAESGILPVLLFFKVAKKGLNETWKLKA